MPEGGPEPRDWGWRGGGNSRAPAARACAAGRSGAGRVAPAPGQEGAAARRRLWSVAGLFLDCRPTRPTGFVAALPCIPGISAPAWAPPGLSPWATPGCAQVSVCSGLVPCTPASPVPLSHGPLPRLRACVARWGQWLGTQGAQHGPWGLRPPCAEARPARPRHTLLCVSGPSVWKNKAPGWWLFHGRTCLETHSRGCACPCPVSGGPRKVPPPTLLGADLVSQAAEWLSLVCPAGFHVLLSSLGQAQPPLERGLSWAPPTF